MAKRQPQDPHTAREASRYANPIPSREFIQQSLRDAGKALSFKSLCTLLAIDGEEQLDALERRLNAMLRDGQLRQDSRERYAAVDEADTLVGRVQGSRDGFGFVVTEAGAEDVYLPNRQMQQVFDGDVVRVAVTAHDRRGRLEGRIIEVLERNTRQLVGRFSRERDFAHVIPDNARISQLVALEAEPEGVKPGDYVVVEITGQPDLYRQPQGRILEVLGDINVPGVATEVSLRDHDIPHEWPPEVEQAARRLGAEPAEADKKARVDLRQMPLMTIDGEDARDFDDAVYCEPRKGGGWRLWVAIADVSHYVQPGSALDNEAQKRATSVYFPDRVVPMFPEALSNGLCSLRPDVDRLCLVCEMTVSAAGRLSGFRFYEGVMRSHARLTYNQVAALLEVEGSDPAHYAEKYRPQLPHLRHLHDLYLALKAGREKRGAIDFETVETRVIYDSEHRIEAIVPVQRNDAHRLIEECMLCANVATAKLFEKYQLEALYRVHQGPKPEKLASLREYLGELGLNLGGGDKPSPEDYQKTLKSVQHRPDAGIIQIMLLRSFRQAVYQPENEGHFGLHYPSYTHFTSPIRRYPDLLVHRAIRWLIRGHKPAPHFHREPDAPKLKREQIYPYDLPALVALGEHCSMAERRADDATRDVMAWLKCEFLKDRVGDSFNAIISAVTGFGMFVELQDLYVEGLVHITELGGDYYRFDHAHQRLVGERTRRVFKLGDAIQVKVLRVDIEQRKIDLGLHGEEGAQSKGGGPSPVSKVAARKGAGKRGEGVADSKPGKSARGGKRRRGRKT